MDSEKSTPSWSEVSFIRKLKPERLSEFFLDSAHHMELLEGESEEDNLGFPFQKLKEEKVILYPGSFSPWHKGHLACLKALPKLSNEQHQVVVIPDYNPWKELRETNLKDEVLTIWDSLSLLRGRREDIQLGLYLGFLANRKKNPTVEWISKVRAKEKWLLMGEDSFLKVHEWYKAKELLTLLKGIYVVPRGENRELVQAQKEHLFQNFDPALIVEFLEHHPYEEYSSTYLRNIQEKKNQN